MTVENTAAPHDEDARQIGTRPTGRKDHERNRRRIIAAARELFASGGGADVQLKDVAEQAGVSQATLFRHIGSKQALLAMAYHDRIAEVTAAAEQALATDDPWQGLSGLLRTMAGWAHQDRGFWEFAAGSEAASHPDHAAMVARIGEVVDRARAAGVLRVDLAVADLVPLLSYAPASPAGRWEVYTDVVLTGLRAA